MTLQKQDSVRPERRLTLLFIATGSIFAFIATILGALMLAQLSGVGIPFNLSLFADHPYLQIFGFLAEFVCGVGYSVIPLFKSKKLANPRVAYLPFSLITTANVLSIVAVLIGEPYYIRLFQVLSFLILVSSVIICYQILDALGRPSRNLAEAEPLLGIGSFSFVLISIIFFVSSTFPSLLRAGGDLFSPGFIYLSLAGFTGSMIFGVELRTVAFRMTNYRKKIARIVGFLQALTISLAFLSTFKDFGFLSPIMSTVFLLSAISFALSIRIFEPRRVSRVLLPLTEGRPNAASHNTISNYSDVCISSSILWLLFSLLIGFAWQVLGFQNLSIRDTLIHSLAIGFIGSAIIAYAAVLLPGVINQRPPMKHLSLLPLAFLNVGLVIRDLGNFYSISFSAGYLPIWEATSGVFIILAMILLMKNIHFGRSKKN